MLFQLTMSPSDRRGASISAEVAKVIDIIDKSGLPYQLTPMCTIIEGSWDKVMPVINRARKMLRRKHNRVYIIIHIDDRKDAKKRITGKIESIERRLGREVRK